MCTYHTYWNIAYDDNEYVVLDTDWECLLLQITEIWCWDFSASSCNVIYISEDVNFFKMLQLEK